MVALRRGAVLGDFNLSCLSTYRTLTRIQGGRGPEDMGKMWLDGDPFLEGKDVLLYRVRVTDSE